MKPLHGQTHYEVLDVSPNASAYEIGRARREACSLYGEQALASYSFFTTEERGDVLARIEEAYTVLSDSTRRAEYDRSLHIDRRAETCPPARTRTVGAHCSDPVVPLETDLRQKVRRGVVNGEAKRIVRRLAGAGVVTGLDLKQLRQAIGLGVEEIEAGTIFGAGLIQALEADRFGDLPSWLNLRNALAEYAELLQADPEKIIDGYMKHITSQV